MGRFVAREAPAVDALVADAVAKIGAEVEALHMPELAGVVLGGGYGRGEGGVFAEGGAERLSNDLDFFAVTVPGASSGALRAVAGALAPIGQAWTVRLGVDVDFVVRTPWRIKHDEARVMIQELVRGHVDVAGRPGAELFKDVVRRPPEDLPWGEAVRLLVNRGVGLVLARASADEAFAERNVNKCVLGAGDAVLITAVGYCVVLLAMLADYLLFRLLLLVRAGEVFTARAVSLIRGVSWCALAISLLFLLATSYFLIALALAFTAALLGLCLRVVKNVIEEATAIKAENDLTV